MAGRWPTPGLGAATWEPGTSLKAVLRLHWAWVQGLPGAVISLLTHPGQGCHNLLSSRRQVLLAPGQPELGITHTDLGHKASCTTATSSY